MSTRAVIAEPYGDEWRGRYHHSDGYPTGLGAAIWQQIKIQGQAQLRRRLLREHSGWSSILGADWSLAPGFCNNVYAFEPFRRIDFRPHCFCHGDRNEKGRWEYRKNPKTWCEWVYIIGKLALTVEKFDYNAKEWRVVGHFPYAGEEPDWNDLEKRVWNEEEEVRVP